MNPQMENNLPLWLQKELEQFGVFEVDIDPVVEINAPASVVKGKTPQMGRGVYYSASWLPAYPNQEPPF